MSCIEQRPGSNTQTMGQRSSAPRPKKWQGRFRKDGRRPCSREKLSHSFPSFLRKSRSNTESSRPRRNYYRPFSVRKWPFSFIVYYGFRAMGMPEGKSRYCKCEFKRTKSGRERAERPIFSVICFSSLTHAQIWPFHTFLTRK